MRRPFTLLTSALACALVSTVLVAQQQPPAQPPAQPPPTQPATQQPPAAAAPTAPKLSFTTDAGMLLIQIKPDQTAAFEELITKIKAGLAKSTDTALKQQMSGFKIYKSSEPMSNNTLYVALVDPTVKTSGEYELFAILQKVLTPEELRDPAIIEMSKKAAAAFAQGYNKLNLTPLGAGM